MQEFNLTIKISAEESYSERVSEGTRFLDLAEKYQKFYKDQIVLVMHDHRLRELNKTVKKDMEISFITMTDKDGKRAYRRSAVLLMQKAANNLWKNDVMIRVNHSLGQGYFCSMEGVELNKANILMLKEEMLRIVAQDYPIEKYNVNRDEAIELFEGFGLIDKKLTMEYRRNSRVNLYSVDGFVDYHFGFMVPSTGYIKWFDLDLYENGFVIMFPNKNGSVVEPLVTSSKLFHTLQDSKKWSQMLGVGTVGALNEAISHGGGHELILLQEALMEERIGNIAAQIAASHDKKFVMIAGPSSSGKTTFSNRLSIQLRAKGLNPHPIGLDDYYIDRDKCPRDENGEFDFECLESIDVEKFNEDMTALLNGEEILMPSFNFKTGRREYRGKKLKLGENDILVIEGIHGLNDKLSYTLPAESKFRIYISALTQLNIDEHNPLPTTDGRLLRRIVRDARTRGTSAQETLGMWASVRRGEEKYIFPFQDSADVMFNSALVYEMAVLKVYAEPLLFQIPRDSEEYLEAKRLLKLLDYFLPLPTEGIAQNSLVREFVGGSCFNV
ncbi:MAG: nucleoside kinase [Lachnospiraceae bacterium]|nr:nucleoside kinase [Lachnospiraceae bacterium]